MKITRSEIAGMIDHTLLKQDATEMAELIEELAENVIIDKKPLLEDMEDYNIDSGVNKIRISYSKYLG